MSEIFPGRLDNWDSNQGAIGAMTAISHAQNQASIKRKLEEQIRLKKEIIQQQEQSNLIEKNRLEIEKARLRIEQERTELERLEKEEQKMVSERIKTIRKALLTINQDIKPYTN